MRWSTVRVLTKEPGGKHETLKSPVPTSHDTHAWVTSGVKKESALEAQHPRPQAQPPAAPPSPSKPTPVQGYVDGAAHSVIKEIDGQSSLAPIFTQPSADGTVFVSAFVDHSIVDTFFHNDTTIVSRSYPLLPAADVVSLVAHGGVCDVASFEAWELSSVDTLTGL